MKTCNYYVVNKIDYYVNLPWFCSAWFTSVGKMLTMSLLFVEHSTRWTPIVKFPTIVTPNVASTILSSVISVFTTTTFNQTWRMTIPRKFTTSLFNKSSRLTYHIPGCFFVTMVASTIWITFTAWIVNLTWSTVWGAKT